MKKLYIETYGCQMNVADSEVVAAIMQMAGYDRRYTTASKPSKPSGARATRW